jgi:hypothetical protein
MQGKEFAVFSAIPDNYRSANIRLRSVVREGMAFDNTTAFANHDSLIGVDARDGLQVAHRTVRPTNRQIRFGGVAHPEVHPEISLGDVVSATANFIDLLSPADGQG